MKSRILLVAALAAMFAAMCTGTVLADSEHPGCFPTIPDGHLLFQMQQGWFANGLVWFICTDTNNIKFATDHDLTLAPKLSSGLGTTAIGQVYLVCNVNQGAVFSTAPTQSDYSPIWQVNNIVWKDVRQARPITNTDPASLSNPNGIPDASLATVTPTSTVVDYPIMAVGPLGGPWFPAPAGSYRIPQGQVLTNYIYTKRIGLPYFVAYCQDQLTNKVRKVVLIVPDAADQTCASIFGANLAPALADFPANDSQRLWCFTDTTGCSQSCQIPVEEWCPTSILNTQFNYSPIEIGTKLDTSNIPASVTINSRDQVIFLISRGLLTPIETHVLNTPILLPG